MVEMGAGEAERSPTCQKNFKALLYDNENLCTLKQIISNVILILCLYFNVQLFQNNLFWCIDKQCIDDKTVMHNRCTGTQCALGHVLEFAHVVQLLLCGKAKRMRGDAQPQSPPLQLKVEGWRTSPPRPHRFLPLRLLEVSLVTLNQ